mmetsp:Transcript_20614/g.30719  ORF Transcript_20614/g.30719 Transcript_20614/m.30719 type:complete len:119 (+) Transcript_20614:222-578(+)|eukprot:CAMPEP_0194752288 /NCGR_PEP_ID=MMETSP0323_2-20130528/6066_1 /TAXON_ID=2866 ORGANISM="Crypthecodinium cohnii, Strain Seligo" /NCGR_SAMPLE_ID=MMETSP0323_2 /ASSEMBLY_ACC=CAM_ASM_000346 /LENGTH=118 /DNA_ID=CAMNT_0039669079 /DNA_START=201 /DNA_END=557 /DNA_ORIENTATION=-
MASKDMEQRKNESERIRQKYPDRVPVICERAPRSNLPEIEKKKFLVPGTMLCGEFKYIIQKHINQAEPGSIFSDQTIYLFVNNRTSLKTGDELSESYETYKSDDGFLYMVYTAEDTLG